MTFFAANQVRVLSALTCLVLIGLAGTASAASVTVTIHNVSAGGGTIRAGLCDKPNWLSYHCPFHGTAVPQAGDVTITFKDVPAGDWAVIAYHDVNDNMKLDENFLGIPTEQFGFTNNPGYNHEPKFAEAQFAVDKQPVELSIDFEK